MDDPFPQHIPREHFEAWRRHRALARLFYGAFKAQQRNHRLLGRWLETPRRSELSSRLALLAVPLAAVVTIATVVAIAVAAVYFVADSVSM